MDAQLCSWKRAKEGEMTSLQRQTMISVFLSNILRHLEEATRIFQEECPLTWASDNAHRERDQI